jgi:hypothetical protein
LISISYNLAIYHILYLLSRGLWYQQNSMPRILINIFS